jgi:hypothetical protein
VRAHARNPYFIGIIFTRAMLRDVMRALTTRCVRDADT